MTRQFLTRMNDDDDDHLAANIASREQELACYDTNIAMFEAQLAALTGIPDTLPAEMQALKGRTPEQVFAIGGETANTKAAAAWNHKERIKLLLFTEQQQRHISELAYNALLAALPDGKRRTDALARFTEAKLAAKT